MKAVLTTILFVGLFGEIISIILSLGWFLITHISRPGDEHADDLFSTLSDAQQSACLERFARSSKNKEDIVVLSCIEQVTSKYSLSAAVVSRFATFGFVWLRLWVAFATGATALSMIQYLAVCPTPVFGTARYSLSLRGAMSLIEQSYYHTLVTISTVGYGDFAPGTLAGRFLTGLAILTAIAVLTIGLNIVVGVTMEGSALAWSGRRDIVYRYLDSVYRNSLYRSTTN